MGRWRTAALLPLVVGIALVPVQALAAFHLWTFSEFFSSPDGSVQFIEMFTTSNFETVENGAQIRTTSGNHVFSFPSQSLPPTANKHILLATSGFSAQAGSVTPDYILPVSSFFNPAGDTVRIFHPSFGEFHSKTFTAVPSDGVQSLNYPPAAGTAVANTPTNFGGMVGSIDLTPPPDTTGDYNGDLTVDAADYTVWRDTLGQSVTPKGSGADGIADGTIDELDYAFWKQHFGDVLGGTGDGSTSIDLVPEPELAALAGSGLAVIFFAAARARSLRGRL